MKKHTGKKASIATGVVTAFLAAAPGTSEATPTKTPEAAALSRGGTVSESALDAIKSKADEMNIKEAKTTKPVVKKPFRKVFAKAGPPIHDQSVISR